jgi:hypothetical protein
MKRREPVAKSLVMFSMILSLASCAYIEKQLGLEEDNFLEETGEFALKYETGIDVDFTPSTPE